MFKSPLGTMRECVGDAIYDHKLYGLLSMLKMLHRDTELCDLATLRDLGRVENGRLIVGEMSYGTLILPELKVITAELLRLMEAFTADGGRLIILGGIRQCSTAMSTRR